MHSNRAMTFRGMVLSLLAVLVLAAIVLGAAIYWRSKSPSHLAAKAQLAIEQRDPQRAIEFLNRALAANPDADVARNIRALLAKAYLDAGREDDARQVLATNLQHAPDDARSVELLAQTHVQPAVRTMQQSIKPLSAGAAREIITLAQKHITELDALAATRPDARFDVARADLLRLIAAIHSEQVRQLRADVDAAKSANDAAAAQRAEAALREWADDPAALKTRVYDLLASARKRNPTFAVAWQNAATYHFEDGDYAAVAKLHREAAAAGVASEPLTVTAANAVIADTRAIADRKRRLDAGLALLREYDAKHPDQPRILVALGQLQLEQNAPDAVKTAAQLANRATALGGGGLDAQLLLVACTLRDNKPAEAIKQLSPLLSSHGSVAQVWYLLGLAQLQSEQFAQSIDAFRKALALNPGMVAARRAWLNAEVRAGNTDAAARLAGQIAREEPFYMPAWSAQLAAAKGSGNVENILQRLRTLSREPSLPDDSRPELARLLATHGALDDADRVLAAYAGQLDLPTLRTHAYIAASRVTPIDAHAAFESLPPPALIAVAVRWAALGQPLPALQLLEKSSAADNPDVKQVRAWMHAQLGEVTKATALAADSPAGTTTTGRMARARLYVLLGLLQAGADELVAIKNDNTNETAGELLQIATTFASLQKREQARATAMQIKKDAPEFARAQMLLAQIASDEARHQDAINLLQPYAAASPPNLPARAMLVQTLLRASKADAALTLAQQTRAQLPANAPQITAWTILAATAAREQRNYDVAASLLQSMKTAQDASPAAIDLALIRLLQHKPDDALAAADSIPDAAPHFMRTTLRFIAAAKDTQPLKPEQLTQANLSTLLAQAAELSPDARRSFLASVQHQRLLPADRDLIATQIATLSADQLRMLALAQRLVESGWATVALGMHENLPKPSAVVLLQRYQAMLDLGRTAEANAALDDLLAAAPQMPVVRQLQARRLVERDDFPGAVAMLEPLAAAQRPDLLTMLAQYLERAGQLDRAVAIHRQLRTDRPNDITAANNLAYTLALSARGDKAKLAEARTHIDHAIAKAGDSPVALPLFDTLGFIQYLSGQNNEALASLTKALPTLRLEPAMHYHLGLAYARTGQPALAKLHLANVQHLARDRKSLPEVPLANEALKQLAATHP